MSGRLPRFFRRLPHGLVALAALAVIAVSQPGVAEASVSGSVTFQASKPQVAYGGWVKLSGALTSHAPCQAGREIRLRSMATGGAWTILKTAETGPKGAFAFGIQPDHSVRYDVWIPSIGSCERVVSTPALPVAVAVRATITGPPNGIQAGSCGALKAAVQPSQAGTPVQFQRLVGGTWTTMGSATLGSSSGATFQRCVGWEDLGIQQWRAYWSAADSSSTQNADGASTAFAFRIVKAPWMAHIDQLIGSRNIGLAVAANGHFLYEYGATVAHVPASNEKLLLSMALLDRLDASLSIRTTASAKTVSEGGVIPGNLWLVGHGDPTVTKQRMAGLADQLVTAGITKIKGSVAGSTSFFAHDWMAPGWKPEFPAEQVALPTALTYLGNTFEGRHVGDPERRAAAALSKMLRARGVTVVGTATAGVAPGGLHMVGQMFSPPLREILHDQNVDSVNFDAEVLGKLLGVLVSGAPGTIDKGADAMHDWAAAHGASTVSEDASGLSYSNRATALGFVKLLMVAEASSWGDVLRDTLPVPGEGTLEHRLEGISMAAKTGTLDDISSLSGWVDLTRTHQPAVFSILSGGFDESDAKDIEDAIVTTLFKNAH